MTDANVVPLHPFDDAEAVAWIRAHLDGDASLGELARQFRWSPSKLRRRISVWVGAGHVTRRLDAKGRVVITRIAADEPSPRLHASRPEGADLEDGAVLHVQAAPTTEPVRIAAPPACRSQLAAGTAAVLLVTAIALAVVGLSMNARFAASFGQSPDASAMLAAIGVALDLLALALPTAAAMLWQRHARGTALTAWMIWLVAITMTLLAAMGFAATNIGDSVVGRERVAVEATALTDKLVRLRAERAGIGETGAVAALEVALQQAQSTAQWVWRITEGCRDVTRAASARACAPVLQLRERVANAQRRDALEVELGVTQARLAVLPTVAAADPQAATAAETVRWLSVGRLNPSAKDIDRLRTIGLTIAPALAGLVAMLALCLSRSAGIPALPTIRDLTQAPSLPPPTEPRAAG